jgi:hypothetical protein
MNAPVGELVIFCDERWKVLATSVETKLCAHPRIDNAWRRLVSSAVWPTRRRLRQYVDARRMVNGEWCSRNWHPS